MKKLCVMSIAALPCSTAGASLAVESATAANAKPVESRVQQPSGPR